VPPVEPPVTHTGWWDRFIAAEISSGHAGFPLTAIVVGAAKRS
jgi:hypothetical protein